MAGESILYVDDDELLAEMGSEMMELGGYKVTTFRNSLEALQYFQNDSSKFDLVATDYEMPKMNGAELAMTIQKIRKDLPIVMITGNAQVTQKDARQWGVDRLLRKPYNLKEIQSILKQVLSGVDAETSTGEEKNSIDPFPCN